MKACFKIQSSFLLESLASPLSLLESSLSIYMCVCVCAYVCVCMCVCVSVCVRSLVHMLSHLVMSKSLWSHGLQPSRVLCSWNFQGGILEWVAISSSRGSFPPRDWTHLLPLQHWQAESSPLHHLKSPIYLFISIYLLYSFTGCFVAFLFNFSSLAVFLPYLSLFQT